jgi:hypothetical protein
MKRAWDYFRKHHIFFFLPLLVLALIISQYTGSNLLLFTFVAIYVFSYYIDSKRGRTNVAERRALDRKGLSYQQFRNLTFVKRWGLTRTAGMVKYIFVFGGLYFGFGLYFLIGAWTLRHAAGAIAFIQDSPANMLIFNVYCFAAGFIVAAVVYLILWISNERRFARLTENTH